MSRVMIEAKGLHKSFGVAAFPLGLWLYQRRTTQ
jgi:hypothetical protein